MIAKYFLFKKSDGTEFFMEDRGKKEKIDFKKRKENMCNSLFEVEHFLRNIKDISKGLKLYNIIKR